MIAIYVNVRCNAATNLEETVTYDVIIRDGLWFDGTGNAPQTRTLGIRDGVVATVSAARWTRPAAPR